MLSKNAASFFLLEPSRQRQVQDVQAGALAVPNFARILLRIFPELFEEFLCFVLWERRPEKFTKNPSYFSMQNSQTNAKKNSQKFSGERAK